MSPSEDSVANGEKTFVMQHVFKDAMALGMFVLHYGPTETHYDIPWIIVIYPGVDGALNLRLECGRFHGLEKWSIYTDILITITKQLDEKDTFSMSHVFDQTQGSNSLKHIPIGERNKYIVDGDFTVKFEVEIYEMEGIKGKLRYFDKESAEKFSDIVLVVQDEKFYVNKMYLSQHSTYFEDLFLKKFSESEQSEVELKEIEPWDFQNFLEVLYGEPAIDDDTIEGILELADMYDAQTATRRCQKFLVEKSKRSLGSKFNLVAKYKMMELVQKYLSEMKTSSDIELAMSEYPTEYDNWVLVELLKKSLSFNSPK